ncbi:MAG: 50S ribosome-binding GTPase [Planctomycetes bacterium]|nr:50S ribosome-binding GTPase [Planctomycetota bacterium]
MSYHPDDTICAIGTATGGAARGMVRVSGPNAIDVIARLFETADGTLLNSIASPIALAGRATIRLGDDSLHELPCDAMLWPTARSYTREPVVELHTLGSPPLVEALLAAVCRAGARLAEPGEFTLRAFLAGRIDLTQAEAVLGVIDARGNNELDAALAQLAGGLARPLQQLREDLLQLLAELEAGLDFVDEDIEFISTEELLARLTSAEKLLAEVAQQMTSRSTAGPAMRVALVGPPNAGKSSLFNAIVARRKKRGDIGRQPSSAAIVSAQRGTTRDYLTAIIELDGMQCELIDTAGVDDASHGTSGWSEIDSTAQALARARGDEATVRLYCVDSTTNESRPTLDVTPRDIFVLTKIDCARHPVQSPDLVNDVAVIATSSHSGQGLDELCAKIRELLASEMAANQGQIVAATADRCRESIRLAVAALNRATEIVTGNGGDELVASELRIALAELGKVVGAVYTDDLLDRIFSTFCIGK